MIRCPNYCASKAALHHFILVLREQLKNGPGNIQVIEIFPPAVQTELHDEKHQPDIKNGSQIGMPLKDFTEAGLDSRLARIRFLWVCRRARSMDGSKRDRRHSTV